MSISIRLNDTIWINGGEGEGSWSKNDKSMMATYFSQGKDMSCNIRSSSSPATTIINNNSQDLYAEVNDVAITSGLLTTFNNHQASQSHPNGDPEPYATTTLAMQNTNKRIMVHIFNP